MKLVYDINQKPPLKKNLVYAFQQLLAIMAATLLVPVLADSTGLYLNQPAALFGAGMGTLFYIFIATRKKSPVFLGSSFAFISPLAGACAYGFLGIFVGSLFAGLVYVLIALIVKKTGTAWVTKLLPPVVIGRRRQLQPGGHPGRSDRLLHHRVRLRKGHAEHEDGALHHRYPGCVRDRPDPDLHRPCLRLRSAAAGQALRLR